MGATMGVMRKVVEEKSTSIQVRRLNMNGVTSAYPKEGICGGE